MPPVRDRTNNTKLARYLGGVLPHFLQLFATVYHRDSEIAQYGVPDAVQRVLDVGIYNVQPTQFVHEVQDKTHCGTV